MTATIGPYSAEVYPTSVRATGAGLAAGAGKFGGFLGQSAVVASLTPALALAAGLVAAPVALAAVTLALAGHETRGKGLEETSGEIESSGFPVPATV
jgi:putative MFS transporter